jgi:ribosomal protein S18 acetylase RimI-like enzyme
MDWLATLLAGIVFVVVYGVAIRGYLLLRARRDADRWHWGAVAAAGLVGGLAFYLAQQVRMPHRPSLLDLAAFAIMAVAAAAIPTLLELRCVVAARLLARSTVSAGAVRSPAKGPAIATSSIDIDPPSPAARTPFPTLRRATVDDAAALAALAERTFRATFAASNTAANLDAHCRSSYGAAIQARELADPAMETLVAVGPGGELVAYGQLRWSGAPDCVVAERPAEVQRLYAEARWHGTGLAQALMAELLALARAGGADYVWLGVWEHNPRAIAFYRKHGFTAVGDHVFPVGDDPQRDLLLVRELPPAAG